MELYIARHAWAGHYGDVSPSNDSQRPLEPGGAERYTQVVQALAERGFAPTAIATSPYVRCRQTAELISLHTPHHPPVEELDALAPGSDFASLCRWSQERDSTSICWVGHMPDVAQLTSLVIGKLANVRFAKGTIAAMRLFAPVGANSGDLHWLVTAKILGV
jgi:phosphohistidine phosphatase